MIAREKVMNQWGFLRLVAMLCAISCVSPLTVALVGGGGVNAGGIVVTVVETQPTFLYIRAGGVGPDGILLSIF